MDTSTEGETGADEPLASTEATSLAAAAAATAPDSTTTKTGTDTATGVSASTTEMDGGHDDELQGDHMATEATAVDDTSNDDVDMSLERERILSQHAQAIQFVCPADKRADLEAWISLQESELEKEAVFGKALELLHEYEKELSEL